MFPEVLSVSKEIQHARSSNNVGKLIIKSGQKQERLPYAAPQNYPMVMVDLPEGTTPEHCHQSHLHAGRRLPISHIQVRNEH